MLASAALKVKVRILDIVPLRESSSHKRSGMARVLKGSHSAYPHVQSAIGTSHTYLCLSSYSWYSFTDSGGWKVELARVAGYGVRQFTFQKAVSHLTTNQAQCSATALIETVDCKFVFYEF